MIKKPLLIASHLLYCPVKRMKIAPSVFTTLPMTVDVVVDAHQFFLQHHGIKKHERYAQKKVIKNVLQKNARIRLMLNVYKTNVNPKRNSLYQPSVIFGSSLFANVMRTILLLLTNHHCTGISS